MYHLNGFLKEEKIISETTSTIEKEIHTVMNIQSKIKQWETSPINTVFIQG